MRYILITCVLLGCVSCSRKNTIESPTLALAISQVWLDADLAQNSLNEIDANTLSEYEQERYRLAEAHLMLKRELRLPTESDLDAMAKYFISCGDEAAASEAYYIQGAYLNYIGDNSPLF